MCTETTTPPCFPLECPVFLQSKCVYYKGTNIPNTLINDMDTLTVSLDKMDKAVFAAMDAQNNFVRNIKIDIAALPAAYTKAI